MTKLEEFLSLHNSKDIDADVKMFNRITSYKKVKLLERLAKNLTQNFTINLTMSLFGGSYATVNKNCIHINIDPIVAYNPHDSFEKLWVKCQGMTAHEAGHILYSDFNVVADNAKKQFICKNSIPKIAEKIVKDNFNSNSSEGKQIMQDLYDAIYGYIYYKNLADMLNSVEDAAIEHHTPVHAPRTYGGIVSMRNTITDIEVATLNKKYPLYKKEDTDEMGYFITEMRHFAVIGYRRDLTPVFLPDILSKDEIEEVEQLGLYSRICSKNTEERNAISEVLLDMLEPLMKKKASSFMKKYLHNLSMSADDLANMMDMELNGHTEMVCSGAMDPSLSGKTKPQNITSDYEIELPQPTMDKINDKLKKRQEEKENSSTNSNPESSQQSQQSSEQNSSNADNSDANSEEANNLDNTNKNTSTNSEENTAENEKTGENVGENDGIDNYDGENSGNDNVLSKKDGLITSSINKKDFDKNKAALEADAAYKDSLSKAEKSFEKENATEFKQSLDDGNGKSPKLENSMGNPNSISDLHKGIKTNYTPSKLIKGISQAGQCIDVNEIHKHAAIFSKKLKEVLMYQAKTRRKNGLKNGTLNDAALSRIITDQRVFRKTINGVEKKARLAVLLDLSGSMNGEKVRDAIAAAYMLAEACEKIKVPISIMGHNTGYNNVNLYHFVEYENYMKKESKAKILAADAGGANHDGLAIFHTATDLVRHRKPKEQLVLLVISDGAPAGINRYWGEIADKDIQKITNAFEKQYDVKTIGIGIGNDVQHVPNIYKNFLLVPNVSKLGDELLKVLKSLLIR